MDEVFKMFIIFVLVVVASNTSFSQSKSLYFDTNYKRNPFIINGDSQKTFKSLETNEHQNDEDQTISGFRSSHEYLEIKKRNSKSYNAFRLNADKKSFEIKSSEKPNDKNAQYKKSFNNQKLSQNALKMSNVFNFQSHISSANQNTLFSDCNATSNTIFIRGRNKFKAPDYLTPLYETTTVFKAQEYLPPINRRPTVTPNKRPSSTINRTTKKSFYTLTSTKTIHNTMTTEPYYTYIPMEKHITTKGPFYIPVTKPPPVSTYDATQTNKNDSKTDKYDPARAMEVPFEDDETLMEVPETKTEKPRDSTTGYAGDVNVVLKLTTPKMMRPVDRVGSERGDVPDDYEDLAMTTTTKPGDAAPAMAKPVPTEPEDEMPTTKLATTVALTTTLRTTNRIQMMTTRDHNRHLLENSSAASTYEMQTTTPMPFKGSEYLPPETTMKDTSPVTIPQNGSTSVPGSPAPALAMNVPTEPEDLPLIPSSSPTPAATTSTSSMIAMMTNNNRHVMDVEGLTTLMKKMHTTTAIPFKGREYLPPKTAKIPVVTASSAVGPAMAIDVPSEPDDLPTMFSTLTTLTDTYRGAITTSAPDTSSFKAPEYLPPTEPSPLPAIAMKVPPEPECDPDTDNPRIDPRSFVDPCVKNEPKPVPPFKGPPYLPPKTRVERSSNKTLSLRDLEWTPRPVWYASVYRKTTDPPYPICGGSIVREDVVISAAHCFWDDIDGLQSADLFAVAARKIYKRYNHPMDKRAQKSDVISINVPPRFLGAKTSFQDDIAVLKLATPFTFTPTVSGLRPICVDFDVEFDREQMKDGHMGTVAGWGYTDANGIGTKVLLWLELPYVEIEKCILNSEQSFLKYITCDKVCAGENDTGKALCRGDSGGGLAFWQGTPARATPYLRGVASTAPSRRAGTAWRAPACPARTPARRRCRRDTALFLEKQVGYENTL